jgi:hypothetical protein
MEEGIQANATNRKLPNLSKWVCEEPGERQWKWGEFVGGDQRDGRGITRDLTHAFLA